MEVRAFRLSRRMSPEFQFLNWEKVQNTEIYKLVLSIKWDTQRVFFGMFRVSVMISNGGVACFQRRIQLGPGFETAPSELSPWP